MSKKEKVKCPTCGNDGSDDLYPIEWAEMVPSHRRVLGVIDGILYIDESYKDYGEAATNDHLFCKKCMNEWGAPKKFKIDFVNEGDYRRGVALHNLIHKEKSE